MLAGRTLSMSAPNACRACTFSIATSSGIMIAAEKNELMEMLRTGDRHWVQISGTKNCPGLAAMSEASHSMMRR